MLLVVATILLTRMVEAFSSTSFIKNVVANVIGVSFLSFALPGILHFSFQMVGYVFLLYCL